MRMNLGTCCSFSLFNAYMTNKMLNTRVFGFLGCQGKERFSLSGGKGG